MGSFPPKSVLLAFILFYVVLSFYPEIVLASMGSEANKNSSAISHSSSIAELEESIMDLQLKSIANKVNIAGSLENSFNYFRTDRVVYPLSSGNGQPTVYYRGPHAGKENNFLAASYARLDFKADINERTKAYISLLAKYYYGEKLVGPEDNDPDTLTSFSRGDTLKIAKGYFDYQVILNSLVFSLGRLPTSLGPPLSYQTLESRLGTYPLLAHSAPADGAALTWHLHHTFDLKDYHTFRSVFALQTPGSHLSPENKMYVTNPNASQLNVGNSKMGVFMYDFSTERLPSIARSIGYIFQYMDMHVEAAPSFTKGPTEGDPNVYMIRTDNKKIAILRSYVNYLEFNDIFKSKLDINFTSKFSVLNPRANLTTIIIQSPNPTYIGRVASREPYLGPNKRTGHQMLLGFRYKFTPNHALGLELINASSGTLTDTYELSRPTQFYNTMGKGFHLFTPNAFSNKSFIVTLGYSNILANKIVPVSNEVSYNRRIETYYALFKVHF